MDYQAIKKNFENHGFMTSYFETGEEAAEYLRSSLRGKRIAIGGSVTAQQMKLDEVLSANNEILWHWTVPGGETLKQARDAQVYICSANGVSETGELVNIDGTGNRVSMTVYGPEKTYFLVGKNKLAPDMHQAMMRAKHVAAPKNALRLNRKTPCVQNNANRCYDCNSPERICKATVILDRPCNGMEVEVVLINQELGF